MKNYFFASISLQETTSKDIFKIWLTSFIFFSITVIFCVNKQICEVDNFYFKKNESVKVQRILASFLPVTIAEYFNDIIINKTNLQHMKCFWLYDTRFHFIYNLFNQAWLLWYNRQIYHTGIYWVLQLPLYSEYMNGSQLKVKKSRLQ